MVSLNLAALPQELKAESRWVLWRLERNAKSDLTKIPYSWGGYKADSTDPSTWGSFDDVVQAFERSGDYSGVGFVLGDGWAGVDLDGCRSPETGAIENWAEEIIEPLNSYTEVSPSGTGVHIVVKGELPAGRRQKTLSVAPKKKVEMFDAGRYFTVTGSKVHGNGSIAPRQRELAELHARVFPPSPANASPAPVRTPLSLNDNSLIDRAMRANDGGKFARLWRGEWEGQYSSQSEADQALCNKLAFWTGRDGSRMDALFRQSGLMREKWDREDYRARTLTAAIEQTVEVYQESSPPSDYRGGNEQGASASEPRNKTIDEEVPAGVNPDENYPAPIGPDAYLGLTGRFVKLVEPHTEADPSLLLLWFLIYAGNVMGRVAFVWAGADKHYSNLYGCAVGPTSGGRKGSATGPVEMFFEEIDGEWVRSIQSGLSSGEGLIWCVRDQIYERQKTKKEKGSLEAYERVCVDEGVPDKRALVRQSELFGALQVMKRQGNTLSPVIRDAWDRGNLNSMTKNSPAKATDAHISIAANITKEELLRGMLSDEMDNGFANRFLWACSRRSRCLPEGGKLWQVKDSVKFTDLQKDFNRISGRVKGPVYRDAEAVDIWGRDDKPGVGLYADLTRERHGMFGLCSARAAPIVPTAVAHLRPA